MALARRTRGVDSFIWPGFVDGLATLLMVIIFVLMVFFLIQMNLAQRVSGQNITLDRLRAELGELASLLNIERQRSGELAALNRQLALDLEASDAELARLGGRASELQRDLDRAAGRNTVVEQENLDLILAVEALRRRLGQIQALLEEKEAEAREAKAVSANLSQQLNDALASKVSELQRFRSEFFGRLRDIVKDRSDIRIVGDRFVFQSEVLFNQGSADIGIDGEAKLRELSRALSEISRDIPTDIDWVLQVSGHTDNVPINTPRYRDNWDLSTERALSVVRYLVLSGIDPNRLSAAGFGEYRPIDSANTSEARARNRRIEFKLTQR